VGSGNVVRPRAVAGTCVGGLTELFFWGCCSDNGLRICALEVELGVEDCMVDGRHVVLTEDLVSWNSSRSNDKEIWEDIL